MNKLLRLLCVGVGLLLMTALLTGCSMGDEEENPGKVTTSRATSTTRATTTTGTTATTSRNMGSDMMTGMSEAMNGIETGVSDAINDIETGVSDMMDSGRMGR